MKRLLFVAVTALLVCCNAVEKFTYRQIDVPDFDFEFDAVISGGTLSRAEVPDGWRSFEANADFDILDPAFSVIAPYRGVVRDVQIGGASISYTPAANEVIYSLTISTESTELFRKEGEASGGGPVSLTSSELDKLERAIKQFVDQKPITIKALGATDASSGTMHFTLQLTDIEVTAGLDL